MLTLLDDKLSAIEAVAFPTYAEIGPLMGAQQAEETARAILSHHYQDSTLL
jgi:hypothetical protein